VTYDPGWPAEFAALASRVTAALGPMAVRVEHVGSTSIPGLAAKDCIDVQVGVHALDEQLISGRFAEIGFRLRPEPWNRVEGTPGGPCLAAASEAARGKLLFRDFLRADDTAREAWGGFKRRLVLMTTDLYEYGQAKAGPTQILMIAAEDWASRTGWTPF